MARVINRQRSTLPLAGSEYSLDWITAQSNENIYPEALPGGGKPTLRSVPGTRTFASLTGTGRGMVILDGVLYALSGTTLHSVSSTGVAQSIGTVLGDEAVSMATNASQIAIATGDDLYVATSSSAALVSDPDAPISPIAVDFVDQYILAAMGDTGQFAFSALSDATDWNALDFATAEGSPDKLVGLLVDHREVWLPGSDSIEVFFNDSTTPFSRTAGGFIEKGCAAGRTFRKLDNTVFWLGTDEIHGPTVYRAQGLTPERVSNAGIESALEAAGDLSGAYAYTWAERGHAFYALTVPDVLTVVYDVATNEWHRRSTWGQADSDFVCVLRCYNKLLAQKRTGQVVELVPGLNQDEGAAIRRRRVSPVLNFGRNRFSILRAEVSADVGTAVLDDAPEVELAVSRDRGRTWGDPQVRSYGQTGDYRQRLIWGPLGGFRDAVLRLTTTSNVVSTWEDITLDIEQFGS